MFWYIMCISFLLEALGIVICMTLDSWLSYYLMFTRVSCEQCPSCLNIWCDVLDLHHIYDKSQKIYEGASTFRLVNNVNNDDDV